MKNRRAFLISVIMLAASLSFGQAASPPPGQGDPSAFVGVWRGNLDNLPALVLTISDEGGSLSGAALFYLHKRQSVNDRWTATPGLPEPLFNLRVEGNTLSFQLSHKHAHPPRTLSDTLVDFRLLLVGPNRARVIMGKRDGKNARGNAPLVMVRSDY